MRQETDDRYRLVGNYAFESRGAHVRVRRYRAYKSIDTVLIVDIQPWTVERRTCTL